MKRVNVFEHGLVDLLLVLGEQVESLDHILHAGVLHLLLVDVANVHLDRAEVEVHELFNLVSELDLVQCLSVEGIELLELGDVGFDRVDCRVQRPQVLLHPVHDVLQVLVVEEQAVVSFV